MCVCVCVASGVCGIYFFSLSRHGPICLIQVNCTSLLFFWKLGHPGSLRRSHLGSELLHECFAQGHRDKHLQRHLPSEAFQLYLLTRLTRSGFSCCLTYCAFILKKQTVQYVHCEWSTRPPNHLSISGPCPPPPPPW